MLSSLSARTASRLRVLKQVGSYGLLSMLQKGCGLLMLPITTRFLGLEQFGTLEALLVLFSLCSLLEISAGALPRFSADCHCRTERVKLLSSSLLLSALYAPLLALSTVLVCSSLDFAVFAKLSNQHWILVGLVITLSIALQPLLTWLRIEERAVAFCQVLALQTLLQLSLTLAGLYLGQGLNAILFASVSSNAVALILAAWLCRQDLSSAISWPLIKTSVQYQVWLIVASLSLFVMHGLDRLLLGNWLGAETLALYGLMLKVSEACALAFGALESWWMPKRFLVLAAERGAHKVVAVHHKMMLCLFALVYAAALLAPPTIRTLFSPEFHAGLVWLPAMLGVMLIKLLTSIFDMGCYYPKKPFSLGLVNGLSAALALGLYLLLIPQLGVNGLLLALGLCYGLRLLVFSYYAQRLCPLPYSWSQLSLCAALLFMPLGLMLLWPDSQVALSVLGLSAVLSILLSSRLPSFLQNAKAAN